MDAEYVRLVGYFLVAAPAMFLATRKPIRVGRRDYLEVRIRQGVFRLPQWWTVFVCTLAGGFIVYWRDTANPGAAAMLALFLAPLLTLGLRNFAAYQRRTKAAFESLAQAQTASDAAQVASARGHLLRQALAPQPALAAVLLAYLGWVLFSSGERLLGYVFAAVAFVVLIAVVVRLVRKRTSARAG